MIPALFQALEALRPAFSRQRSFHLVRTLLVGLLFSGKYTTLTAVFLSVRELLPQSLSRYWSLPAMLRRRSWRCEDLIEQWLGFLLRHLPSGGYLLADVTHTTTQGKRQQQRHLRPNPQYRRGGQNQSKFVSGNSMLSMAYVLPEHLIAGSRYWVFGLGCLLLRVGSRSHTEKATLRRVLLRLVPAEMLLVYDRGGNDAATINTALRHGRRLVTRLNANAALYHDRECRRRIDPWQYQQQLKRGDRMIYRFAVLCYRTKVRAQLKVVIEIFYDRHRRQWRAVYYLSTDLQMSAAEIVAVYQSRVEIESVHEDSKLLCGLNSCRVHSARAIEGYTSLAILACGLLEYTGN